MIAIAQETLDLRPAGFSPALQVTHANILTSPDSTASREYGFSVGKTLPYHTRCEASGISSFGAWLSPGKFSAR